METLKYIHNALTATIFLLFVLICFLVNKCSLVYSGNDEEIEITGEITPSNNIIVNEPGQPTVKLPLYNYLVNQAGEPSGTRRQIEVIHAPQPETDFATRRALTQSSSESEASNLTNKSDEYIKHTVKVKVRLSDSESQEEIQEDSGPSTASPRHSPDDNDEDADIHHTVKVIHEDSDGSHSTKIFTNVNIPLNDSHNRSITPSIKSSRTEDTRNYDDSSSKRTISSIESHSATQLYDSGRSRVEPRVDKKRSKLGKTSDSSRGSENDYVRPITAPAKLLSYPDTERGNLVSEKGTSSRRYGDDTEMARRTSIGDERRVSQGASIIGEDFKRSYDNTNQSGASHTYDRKRKPLQPFGDDSVAKPSPSQDEAKYRKMYVTNTRKHWDTSSPVNSCSTGATSSWEVKDRTHTGTKDRGSRSHEVGKDLIDAKDTSKWREKLNEPTYDDKRPSVKDESRGRVTKRSYNNTDQSGASRRDDRTFSWRAVDTTEAKPPISFIDNKKSIPSDYRRKSSREKDNKPEIATHIDDSKFLTKDRRSPSAPRTTDATLASEENQRTSTNSENVGSKSQERPENEFNVKKKSIPSDYRRKSSREKDNKPEIATHIDDSKFLTKDRRRSPSAPRTTDATLTSEEKQRTSTNSENVGSKSQERREKRTEHSNVDQTPSTSKGYKDMLSRMSDKKSEDDRKKTSYLPETPAARFVDQSSNINPGVETDKLSRNTFRGRGKISFGEDRRTIDLLPGKCDANCIGMKQRSSFDRKRYDGRPYERKSSISRSYNNEFLSSNVLESSGRGNKIPDSCIYHPKEISKPIESGSNITDPTIIDRSPVFNVPPKSEATFFEKDETRKLYDKIRAQASKESAVLSEKEFIPDRPSTRRLFKREFESNPEESYPRKSEEPILIYNKDTGKYEVSSKYKIPLSSDEESCKKYCDRMRIPICCPVDQRYRYVQEEDTGRYLSADDGVTPNHSGVVSRKRARRPISDDPIDKDLKKYYIPSKKVKQGADDQTNYDNDGIETLYEQQPRSKPVMIPCSCSCKTQDEDIILDDEETEPINGHYSMLAKKYASTEEGKTPDDEDISDPRKVQSHPYKMKTVRDSQNIVGNEGSQSPHVTDHSSKRTKYESSAGSYGSGYAASYSSDGTWRPSGQRYSDDDFGSPQVRLKTASSRKTKPDDVDTNIGSYEIQHSSARISSQIISAEPRTTTISSGAPFPPEETFETPKKRDEEITRLYKKYGSPTDIARLEKLDTKTDSTNKEKHDEKESGSSVKIPVKSKSAESIIKNDSAQEKKRNNKESIDKSSRRSLSVRSIISQHSDKNKEKVSTQSVVSVDINYSKDNVKPKNLRGENKLDQSKKSKLPVLQNNLDPNKSTSNSKIQNHHKNLEMTVKLDPVGPILHEIMKSVEYLFKTENPSDKETIKEISKTISLDKLSLSSKKELDKLDSQPDIGAKLNDSSKSFSSGSNQKGTNDKQQYDSNFTGEIYDGDDVNFVKRRQREYDDADMSLKKRKVDISGKKDAVESSDNSNIAKNDDDDNKLLGGTTITMLRSPRGKSDRMKHLNDNEFNGKNNISPAVKDDTTHEEILSNGPNKEVSVSSSVIRDNIVYPSGMFQGNSSKRFVSEETVPSEETDKRDESYKQSPDIHSIPSNKKDFERDYILNKTENPGTSKYKTSEKVEKKSNKSKNSILKESISSDKKEIVAMVGKSGIVNENKTDVKKAKKYSDVKSKLSDKKDAYTEKSNIVKKLTANEILSERKKKQKDAKKSKEVKSDDLIPSDTNDRPKDNYIASKRKIEKTEAYKTGAASSAKSIPTDKKGFQKKNTSPGIQDITEKHLGETQEEKTGNKPAELLPKKLIPHEEHYSKDEIQKGPTGSRKIDSPNTTVIKDHLVDPNPFASMLDASEDTVVNEQRDDIAGPEKTHSKAGKGNIRSSDDKKEKRRLTLNAALSKETNLVNDKADRKASNPSNLRFSIKDMVETNDSLRFLLGTTVPNAEMVRRESENPPPDINSILSNEEGSERRSKGNLGEKPKEDIEKRKSRKWIDLFKEIILPKEFIAPNINHLVQKKTENPSTSKDKKSDEISPDKVKIENNASKSENIISKESIPLDKKKANAKAGTSGIANNKINTSEKDNISSDIKKDEKGKRGKKPADVLSKETISGSNKVSSLKPKTVLPKGTVLVYRESDKDSIKYCESDKLEEKVHLYPEGKELYPSSELRTDMKSRPYYTPIAPYILTPTDSEEGADILFYLNENPDDRRKFETNDSLSDSEESLALLDDCCPQDCCKKGKECLLVGSADSLIKCRCKMKGEKKGPCICPKQKDSEQFRKKKGSLTIKVETKIEKPGISSLNSVVPSKKYSNRRPEKQQKPSDKDNFDEDSITFSEVIISPDEEVKEIIKTVLEKSSQADTKSIHKKDIYDEKSIILSEKEGIPKKLRPADSKKVSHKESNLALPKDELSEKPLKKKNNCIDKEVDKNQDKVIPKLPQMQKDINAEKPNTSLQDVVVPFDEELEKEQKKKVPETSKKKNLPVDKKETRSEEPRTAFPEADPLHNTFNKEHEKRVPKDLQLIMSIEKDNEEQELKVFVSKVTVERSTGTESDDVLKKEIYEEPRKIKRNMVKQNTVFKPKANTTNNGTDTEIDDEIQQYIMEKRSMKEDIKGKESLIIVSKLDTVENSTDTEIDEVIDKYSINKHRTKEKQSTRIVPNIISVDNATSSEFNKESKIPIPEKSRKQDQAKDDNLIRTNNVSLILDSRSPSDCIETIFIGTLNNESNTPLENVFSYTFTDNIPSSITCFDHIRRPVYKSEKNEENITPKLYIPTAETESRKPGTISDKKASFYPQGYEFEQSTSRSRESFEPYYVPYISADEEREVTGAPYDNKTIIYADDAESDQYSRSLRPYYTPYIHSHGNLDAESREAETPCEINEIVYPQEGDSEQSASRSRKQYFISADEDLNNIRRRSEVPCDILAKFDLEDDESKSSIYSVESVKQYFVPYILLDENLEQERKETRRKSNILRDRIRQVDESEPSAPYSGENIQPYYTPFIPTDDNNNAEKTYAKNYQHYSREDDSEPSISRAKDLNKAKRRDDAEKKIKVPYFNNEQFYLQENYSEASFTQFKNSYIIADETNRKYENPRHKYVFDPSTPRSGESLKLYYPYIRIQTAEDFDSERRIYEDPRVQIEKLYPEAVESEPFGLDRSPYYTPYIIADEYFDEEYKKDESKVYLQDGESDILIPCSSSETFYISYSPINISEIRAKLSCDEIENNYVQDDEPQPCTSSPRRSQPYFITVPRDKNIKFYLQDKELFCSGEGIQSFNTLYTNEDYVEERRIAPSNKTSKFYAQDYNLEPPVSRSRSIQSYYSPYVPSIEERRRSEVPRVEKDKIYLQNNEFKPSAFRSGERFQQNDTPYNRIVIDADFSDEIRIAPVPHEKNLNYYQLECESSVPGRKIIQPYVIQTIHADEEKIKANDSKKTTNILSEGNKPESVPLILDQNKNVEKGKRGFVIEKDEKIIKCSRKKGEENLTCICKKQLDPSLDSKTHERANENFNKKTRKPEIHHEESVAHCPENDNIEQSTSDSREIIHPYYTSHILDKEGQDFATEKDEDVLKCSRKKGIQKQSCICKKKPYPLSDSKTHNSANKNLSNEIKKAEISLEENFIDDDIVKTHEGANEDLNKETIKADISYNEDVKYNLEYDKFEPSTSRARENIQQNTPYIPTNEDLDKERRKAEILRQRQSQLDSKWAETEPSTSYSPIDEDRIARSTAEDSRDEKKSFSPQNYEIIPTSSRPYYMLFIPELHTVTSSYEDLVKLPCGQNMQEDMCHEVGESVSSMPCQMKNVKKDRQGFIIGKYGELIKCTCSSKGQQNNPCICWKKQQLIPDDTTRQNLIHHTENLINEIETDLLNSNLTDYEKLKNYKEGRYVEPDSNSLQSNRSLNNNKNSTQDEPDNTSTKLTTEASAEDRIQRRLIRIRPNSCDLKVKTYNVSSTITITSGGGAKIEEVTESIPSNPLLRIRIIKPQQPINEDPVSSTSRPTALDANEMSNESAREYLVRIQRNNIIPSTTNETRSSENPSGPSIESHPTTNLNGEELISSHIPDIVAKYNESSL